jgi:hypothetical protein
VLKRATARIAAALFLLAAGCAHAEIPYDLSRIEPSARPVHAMRIAVLPFTDARTSDDGPDNAERFIYRGVELAHTDLGALQGSPLSRVTEIVGKHIARSRVFSQVILVESSDQAPEADLLLSGRLRRMRGYVEADKPPKESGRPENERLVLAEVVLAGIELRDARDPEKVLFDADVGWSVEDKRLEGDHPIDPWGVLAEALYKAVSDLVQEISKADLSGAHVVRARVDLDVGEGGVERAFGDLDSRAPEGWRFARTATASEPTGWSASDARCVEARLEQKQTLRFHRLLGPYRPAVMIWACPSDLHLAYDSLEEFPARYIGDRADGSHYFAWAVGESNWPDAIEQIGRHLGLVPPKHRYVFEIGQRRK